ncbi:MAG TPA: DUF222 domain-containing protein [Acidimicrobiales bacterium]|nr:DUF222 domain-containing protein [Acidimicrobiales bacterium]
MTIHSQTIYGETLEDLLPGLIAVAEAMQIGADGMFHASVKLAPREGRPLHKALMRVEAALMLEDADRIGSVGYEDRTYEQRAHDAFMRLVQAIGGASWNAPN